MGPIFMTLTLPKRGQKYLFILFVQLSDILFVHWGLVFLVKSRMLPAF